MRFNIGDRVIYKDSIGKLWFASIIEIKDTRATLSLDDYADDIIECNIKDLRKRK